MEPIKQGEAKALTFTIQDQDQLPADLSAADLTMGLKAQKDQSSYDLIKQDDDFDKNGATNLLPNGKRVTGASQGCVAVFLSAEDTAALSPGTYFVEIQALWTATYPPTILKTVDPLKLEVVRAVITA